MCSHLSTSILPQIRQSGRKQSGRKGGRCAKPCFERTIPFAREKAYRGFRSFFPSAPFFQAGYASLPAQDNVGNVKREGQAWRMHRGKRAVASARRGSYPRWYAFSAQATMVLPRARSRRFAASGCVLPARSLTSTPWSGLNDAARWARKQAARSAETTVMRRRCASVYAPSCAMQALA